MQEILWELWADALKCESFEDAILGPEMLLLKLWKRVRIKAVKALTSF